jgi:hypothetical protein
MLRYYAMKPTYLIAFGVCAMSISACQNEGYKPGVVIVPVEKREDVLSVFAISDEKHLNEKSIIEISKIRGYEIFHDRNDELKRIDFRITVGWDKYHQVFRSYKFYRGAKGTIRKIEADYSYKPPMPV